jgi:hypothetical protein
MYMYVCVYIVYNVCMERRSQSLTIHFVGILCEVLRLQFPINCVRVCIYSCVQLDYGLFRPKQIAQNNTIKVCV